jgi:hypothetical protein
VVWAAVGKAFYPKKSVLGCDFFRIFGDALGLTIVRLEYPQTIFHTLSKSLSRQLHKQKSFSISFHLETIFLRTGFPALLIIKRSTQFWSKSSARIQKKKQNQA